MAAARLTATLFSSFASYLVSPSLIWRGFLVTLGKAASTPARPASTPAQPPLLGLSALAVLACLCFRARQRQPPPYAAGAFRWLRAVRSAALVGFACSACGRSAGLPFQRGGLPFQRLCRVYKCKVFNIWQFTFVMLSYICNCFAPRPRKVLRGSSPLPSNAVRPACVAARAQAVKVGLLVPASPARLPCAAPRARMPRRQSRLHPRRRRTGAGLPGVGG